jgi:hypothetical protein
MSGHADVERGSPDPAEYWFGNYQFGRDRSFFAEVVNVARRYVDREPDRRPSDASFQTELGRLRSIASKAGRGLVDQLEHRWLHPDCPPALYVITYTLRAPAGEALVDEDERLVQELPCTKLGKAKRTVAARIERYTWDVVGGVSIADRSQDLRVLIYGHGPTMVHEREILKVARLNGSRAEVVNGRQLRRRVGSETYKGVDLVEALSTFVRERAGVQDKR